MSHSASNLVSERGVIEKGEEKEEERVRVSEMRERGEKGSTSKKKGTRGARARLFHFAADKRRRDCRERTVAPLLGPGFAIESERAGNAVLAVCAGPAGSLTARPRLSTRLACCPRCRGLPMARTRLKSGSFLSFPLPFSTFHTRARMRGRLKKKKKKTKSMGAGKRKRR